MSGFLYKSLYESALAYNQKICLSMKDDESLSFSHFFEDTNRCIEFIKSLSLKKGDIIFLALGTSREFCSLLYACNALGIVVVPVSTKIKADGLTSLLKTIQPKVVFYDTQYQPFIPQLEDVACTDIKTVECQDIKKYNSFAPASLAEIHSLINEYDEEAVAIIMFTSGTTGTPKGARISNHNIKYAVKAYEEALKLDSNDSTILGVPIFHITGLVAILSLFIYIGGTTYLEKRFNSKEILDLIDEKNISFLHGSPTVFALLHQENMHLNGKTYLSLRSIACGAGRLNRGIINSLKLMFPNSQIHSVYGLTESTSPCTIYRGDVSSTLNADSSGTAVLGASVKICDDNGNDIGFNKVGKIYISGDMVINSYYPENSENKKLFKNSYLNTGDVGYIDEQGHLYVKDRVKDIINRGGEKIFCPEVESLISTFEDVIEVAIVAKEDPIYGEIPVAYIRVRDKDNFNVQQLNLFLKDHLAKFQIPTSYVFVDDFPRTNNEKINKRLLRQLYN